MRVRIHRGTREIGGTCIEVEAQGKRIALDVGLPLDAPEDASAAVFEFMEGAFNPVALFVERGVIGPGRTAASPGWNHRCSPLALNVLNKCLTVRAFVGDDVTGAEAGEEGPSLRTGVPRPSGDKKAHGPPVAIRGEMHLGGHSASGPPHSRRRVPPFPVTAC